METNDDTITLKEAACGYKGPIVIELCFRALKKTRIKIYHWAPIRIEAHVKICTLALLIGRVGRAPVRAAVEQNFARSSRAANFIFFYASSPLLQAKSDRPPGA